MGALGLLLHSAGRAGQEESSEGGSCTQGRPLFSAMRWLQGGGELTMPWPYREKLEGEQLLDGRYRLQKVQGGRVALPVLEEKLSQLWLPREMPCDLVQIQVQRDPLP